MQNIFLKYKSKFLLSLEEYFEVYITLLVTACIFLYLSAKYRKVETEGVFIVCKINNYEPDSDGSTTYCTAYLNGQEYNFRSGEGNGSMVGKYYFGKVLKEDPYFQFILYPDQEVPGCILNDTLSKAGWTTIPVCK